MDRLSLHAVSRPWTSILLAAALALGLGGGILRLKIDNSTGGLFLIDDPEVRYLADVRANFGPDPDLIVVVRGGDLASTLRPAKDLADAIGAVPGVGRTASPFSNESVREETLEFQGRTFRRIVPGPVVDAIPESDEELEKLEREIRENAILRGTVVNEAGDALIVQVFFDDRQRANARGETVAAVEGVVRTFRGSDGSEAYLFGRAFVEAAVAASIWQNLLVLGPIAVGVVLLIVLVFFRSAVVAPIPFVTGALSTAATLGLMGYLGFALNPISSTIVVLLFVIGCAEDLRLISEYAAGIRAGIEREEAVRALGRNVLRAAALATLTTFLGFLAIVPNSIPQLREFAISCAAGIVINFVLTVLLVPALLAILPVPRSFRRAHGADRLLNAVVARFVLPAAGRRRLVCAAFALAAVLAGIGALRLGVDTNYLRFFDEDSAVNRAAAKFSRDFGGTSTFLVAVETGRKDGVREPETFQRLAAFSDRLDERFERALSAADLVRGLRSWLGEDAGLPATQEDLNEVLSILPASLRDAFVDHDGSRALIRVRSASRGSKGMRSDEEAVRRMAGDVLPPDFQVRVCGEIPLLHRFADVIAGQLLQGLLFVLAAILLVFTIAFRSFRDGIVGILPNIFPALVTLGAMGWMGIPLSVGTFSIAIIALGISADDTVHLMARHHKERGSGCAPAEAIANALFKEIRPVTATTIAITVGFLVLGFSSLVLHREAAVLYAVAFVSAFVADLLLLPCLLARR